MTNEELIDDALLEAIGPRCACGQVTQRRGGLRSLLEGVAVKARQEERLQYEMQLARLRTEIERLKNAARSLQP